MSVAETLQNLGKTLYQAWREGTQVSFSLFKSLIPIIILVKMLSELGVIQYIAMPLSPIMQMVGLPPELGLAWAAAMLVNIYSGMVVFLSLLPGLDPLSVGQVTTFSLMILIAHNLILEGRIAGQCGISGLFQVVLRIVMAVLGGLSMYWLCRLSGAFAGPAAVLLEGKSPATLGQWAIGEILNLVKIYFLVWGVMLLQRVLDHFKITDLLNRLLFPVLRLLGISSQAATIIIISFSMGLIYGSGAILKSVREGKVSRHDVFMCLSIVGVAHSLIEDTLLTVVLGASLWGVLLLRLILALVLGLVMNQIYLRFGPHKAVAPA